MNLENKSNSLGIWCDMSSYSSSRYVINYLGMACLHFASEINIQCGQAEVTYTQEHTPFTISYYDQSISMVICGELVLLRRTYTAICTMLCMYISCKQSLLSIVVIECHQFSYHWYNYTILALPLISIHSHLLSSFPSSLPSLPFSIFPTIDERDIQTRWYHNVGAKSMRCYADFIYPRTRDVHRWKIASCLCHAIHSYFTVLRTYTHTIHTSKLLYIARIARRTWACGGVFW